MTIDEQTTRLYTVAESALLDRLTVVSLAHFLDTVRAFRHYARVPTHTTPPLDPDMPLSQPRTAIGIARAAGLTNSGSIVRMLVSGTGPVAVELRRHVLYPDVVVALATALAYGRAEEGRRLQAFADWMASVDFVPRAGREGQRGYAPNSLQHRVDSVKLLLDRFVEASANDYDGDIPELRRWRRAVPAASVTPHPGAGDKELLTPPIESIIEQMAYLDEQIAALFRRLTGVSDLELSEERWCQAFPNDPARRKWILRTGLLRLTRSRALVAIGVETTLRSLGLHELRWSGFNPSFSHAALTCEKGADEVGGAVYGIGMKGHPARFKPISLQATRRVLVYRWIVKALIAPRSLDDYPQLCMWTKVSQAGVPSSLGEQWINDIFRTRKASRPDAKNPHKAVLCPMDPAAVRDNAAPRIGAGPHGIRRAGDQIIFHYFQHWKATHPKVAPGLEGVHVKEACLDHRNIPGDVLGYTGLRGEAARVVLSYYGSRTVAAAVYDGLTLPRGPDEQAIRKTLLDLRAVSDLEFDLEWAVREENSRLRDMNDSSIDIAYLQECVRDAKQIAGQKADHARNRRSQLTWARTELERRLTFLVDDRRTWVVTPTDATPLSPTDVERLRGSLLTADGDLLGPNQVRDFLLQREVAAIRELSTETLRRQRKNDPRCRRSRFYPCEDQPVFDLDQREPLYHPGGWYPELITEEIANRVRSLLSVWPSDPDWRPGGAKRRKLERLGPIQLPGRRLNPLGSSDGGSYFRFRDSSGRRAA